MQLVLACGAYIKYTSLRANMTTVKFQISHARALLYTTAQAIITVVYIYIATYNIISGIIIASCRYSYLLSNYSQLLIVM